MVGDVYCPLSPRDPEHRLHALIQETQSRLVLIYHFTKNKFNDNIILLDISNDSFFIPITFYRKSEEEVFKYFYPLDYANERSENHFDFSSSRSFIISIIIFINE